MCSILNIRNEDQKSFQWSVVAAIHPHGSADIRDYMIYENELKHPITRMYFQHKQI